MWQRVLMKPGFSEISNSDGYPYTQKAIQLRNAFLIAQQTDGRHGECHRNNKFLTIYTDGEDNELCSGHGTHQIPSCDVTY